MVEVEGCVEDDVTVVVGEVVDAAVVVVVVVVDVVVLVVVVGVVFVVEGCVVCCGLVMDPSSSPTRLNSARKPLV